MFSSFCHTPNPVFAVISVFCVLLAKYQMVSISVDQVEEL